MWIDILRAISSTRQRCFRSLREPGITGLRCGAPSVATVSAQALMLPGSSHRARWPGSAARLPGPWPMAASCANRHRPANRRWRCCCAGTLKKQVMRRFIPSYATCPILSTIQPVLNECGFAYEEHLNYLIDLKCSPEQLLQNIGPRTRKHIRRALRRGQRHRRTSHRPQPGDNLV